MIDDDPRIGRIWNISMVRTDEKVAEVGQAAPGACTDIDENTMYSSRAGEQIYLSLYLLSDQSVGGSVCLCSYQPGWAGKSILGAKLRMYCARRRLVAEQRRVYTCT